MGEELTTHSVIATSIARVTTLDTSSKSSDILTGTLTSTVWTTIEANTAIICACLPSFKRPMKELVVRVFPNSRLARSERSHQAGYMSNRNGRDDDVPLGGIAIRTDVDVEFEQRSREPSTVSSHGPKTRVEAREMA